ncbi:bifunctional transcriptional activator/DNA repair enzyme AdaA [Sinimarinibacterium thermocellulolyticum]|uniref:Methylated-DNA--protein-cysteine methyltransferase n=1 Tax=Sinimarinibacterium thermocellulolyticum TaxID=3170016 RepID=A0ABV2A7X0_9GAMM
MPQLPSTAEMQRAYLACDAGYDGVFYFGVRTTGIFCKPSCRAKKPRPENVEFFADARAASLAGYRPCKRCRPLDAPGTPPPWIARLIEDIERDPARRIRERELRERGLDPARVRRWFKDHCGMSFSAYCRGRRMNTALQAIRNGESVTDLAIGHGFESESGFRSAFERSFGRAPADAGLDPIRVAWLDSPLGPMLAAARDEGIVLLEFTERRMLKAQFDALRKHFKVPLVPGEHPHLARLRVELAEYFRGARTSFTLPLVFPGSAFQRTVWTALLDIPYGQTRSYQDLAQVVGRPGACRAVGSANGKNRIAILIPCHRVVNKNGALGGYGGGRWRKQRLFEIERDAAARSGDAATGGA